jgi:hypothetical protein
MNMTVITSLHTTLTLQEVKIFVRFLISSFLHTLQSRYHFKVILFVEDEAENGQKRFQFLFSSSHFYLFFLTLNFRDTRSKKQVDVCREVRRRQKEM